MFSCGNDDDGTTDVEIVIRDRNEQQVIDNNSLIEFLETHYYNSDVFENNANASISDLVILPLATGETVPNGYTLLKDAVGVSRKTTFADTDYEFYVLVLNEGGGDFKPSFADNILTTYQGYTLDDNLNDITDAFDSKTTPDTYFGLIDLIPAWRRVFPMFNVANGYVDNGDGTVNFNNPGMGVMFIPSGLAYFQEARTDLPSYSPLIFKFELIHAIELDHDGDGIPSYLEELSGNQEFNINSEAGVFDGDDTDENSIPNYFDTDDDGDGVSTATEISELFEIKKYNEPTKAALEALTFAANEKLVHIVELANGTFTGTTITAADTDGDGIFDYLDAD